MPITHVSAAMEVLKKDNPLTLELEEAVAFLKGRGQLAKLITVISQQSKQFQFNLYRGCRHLDQGDQLGFDFLFSILGVTGEWDRPGHFTVPNIKNDLLVYEQVLLILVQELHLRGKAERKKFKDDSDLTAHLFYQHYELADQYRLMLGSVFLNLGYLSQAPFRLRYIHMAAQTGHPEALQELARCARITIKTGDNSSAQELPGFSQDRPYYESGSFSAASFLLTNPNPCEEEPLFLLLRSLFALRRAAFKKIEYYKLAARALTEGDSFDDQIGELEGSIEEYTRDLLSAIKSWMFLPDIQNAVYQSLDVADEPSSASASMRPSQSQQPVSDKYTVSDKMLSVYIQEGLTPEEDMPPHKFELVRRWLDELWQTQFRLGFSTGTAGSSIFEMINTSWPTLTPEIRAIVNEVDDLNAEVCVALSKKAAQYNALKAFIWLCRAYGLNSSDDHLPRRIEAQLSTCLSADRPRWQVEYGMAQLQRNSLRRDRTRVLLAGMTQYFVMKRETYAIQEKKLKVQIEVIQEKITQAAITGQLNLLPRLQQDLDEKRRVLQHYVDKEGFISNADYNERYLSVLDSSFANTERDLFKLLTSQGSATTLGPEEMSAVLQCLPAQRIGMGRERDPLKDLKTLASDVEKAWVHKDSREWFRENNFIAESPENRKKFVDDVKAYLRSYWRYVFDQYQVDNKAEHYNALLAALDYYPEGLGETCLCLVRQADRSCFEKLAILFKDKVPAAVKAALSDKIEDAALMRDLTGLLAWSQLEDSTWSPAWQELRPYFGMHLDSLLAIYLTPQSTPKKPASLIQALELCLPHCEEKIAQACFRLIDKKRGDVLRVVFQQHSEWGTIIQRYLQKRRAEITREHDAAAAAVTTTGFYQTDHGQHFAPDVSRHSFCIFTRLGRLRSDMCQMLTPLLEEKFGDDHNRYRKLLLKDVRDVFDQGGFSTVQNGRVVGWLSEYGSFKARVDSAREQQDRVFRGLKVPPGQEVQEFLLKKNRGTDLGQLSSANGQVKLAEIALDTFFKSNVSAICEYYIYRLSVDTTFQQGPHGLLLMAALAGSSLRIWRHAANGGIELLLDNHVPAADCNRIEVLLTDTGFISLSSVANPAEYQTQQLLLGDSERLERHYDSIKKCMSVVTQPPQMSAPPPVRSMGSSAGAAPPVQDSPPRYQRDARYALEGAGPQRPAIVPRTLLFPPDEPKPKKSSGCCCGGQPDDDLEEAFLGHDIRRGIN